MEFKKLVRENRSYRGYDGTYQVSKEELVQLVDMARLTPSGMNRQPLRYHIAFEKAEVAKIQSLTKWAAALTDRTLPYEGQEPTGFIVLCQDMRLSDNLSQFRTDVGICAQTICLGAVSMELGACMIGNFNGKEMKEALALSDDYFPLLVIAIGKPKETIVLEEVNEEEDLGYYRDAQDVHHVTKRRLEDILI